MVRAKGTGLCLQHGVGPNVVFRPERIVELIWVGWLISWLAASFWSDRAQKRLASLDTWTYRAALIAGAILLAPPTAWLLSQQPLRWLGYPGTSALTASMFVGLSITWWARIYLDRLWSGVATRKEDHRHVDTGPYAFIRHRSIPGLLSHYLRQRPWRPRS